MKIADQFFKFIGRWNPALLGICGVINLFIPGERHHGVLFILAALLILVERIESQEDVK